VRKFFLPVGVSFILMTALASAQVTRGPITRGVASGLKYVLGTSITEASDGVLTLLNNAGTSFSQLQFGGTTSSFPSLKRSTSALEARLADDSAYTSINASGFNTTGGGSVSFSGVRVIVNTAPTISSGFGGTPSIANNNGTASFTINVGSGAAATSGVVGLPTATTGWNCFVNDLTAAAAHVAYNTRQTASTTASATLENQTTSTGVAIAWGANDILRVSCFAY
jgi:hypothetical protein